MAMKLLPKSEVERLKSVEQKQAVDEGLKLAKRVDNLREIAASEEVSLENFRRETVAKIHEEIKEVAEKRDSLKTEVAVLEEKRKKALGPLETAWQEIKGTKEYLDVLREGLAERERKVGELEFSSDNTRKEADGILARANTKDQLSNTRLHDIEVNARASELALTSAQKAETDSLAKEKQVVEALTHRVNIVTTREGDATIRETELLAREKRLADGWILLRDREATLERNFARLKKHNG